MKKPTIILALMVAFTASSLLAKGTYTGGSCGTGGSGGHNVPDAASTTMLVGVAIGALGAGRRFFRR
jgi:hypothetical protein